VTVDLRVLGPVEAGVDGHPVAIGPGKPRACKIAGRRLTRAEWSDFLPGRPHDPAC